MELQVNKGWKSFVKQRLETIGKKKDMSKDYLFIIIF